MAKGTITSWNDVKGFGFVSQTASSERLFVHVRAFPDRKRRPAVGDVIRFSTGRDEQGRVRVENARFTDKAVAANSPRGPARATTWPHLLVALFLAGIAGAVLMADLPSLVFFSYLMLSLLTFSFYALDKSAAQDGAWRVPENTLHLLAVSGGWPGALLAQTSLRHKSRKQPFRSMFWVTVAINLGILTWLLSPQGQHAMQVLSQLYSTS